MAIAPDTKNWTWVVEHPCPDCGFDPSTAEFVDLPGWTRAAAGRWTAVLVRPDAATRPDARTWSALEYGAHVRDVCRIFLERLSLMLEHHDPSFADWDQDAAAVAGRYGEQDPATVAQELADAAEAIAVVFASVPGEALGRRGLRGDGSAFTVRTLALYFRHDLTHHLHDVLG